MFAITLTALLSLAALFSAEDVVDEPPFKTVEHKGDVYADLNVVLDTIYIPEGESSASVDDLLKCNIGVYLVAVRVTAKDFTPYPLVFLDDDLSSAVVVRAPGTNYEKNAEVVVELACHDM